MDTMEINCPAWLPWLSDEQAKRGTIYWLQRYAKGPRLRMFREVFWTAYVDCRSPPGGPSWRSAVEKLGYTEPAGWCYVE